MSPQSEPSLTMAWVALGLGLVAGVVAMLRLKRHEDPEAARETDLQDAQEQAAHYIDQLRELGQQRARLDPQVYEQQKAFYEQKAANNLRAQDELSADSAPKTDSTPQGDRKEGFFDKRPQLRGFLWGGGTVAVFALLFALVSSEQTPRAESGSMTGNAQSPAPQNSTDVEIQELLGKLRNDPRDIDSLLKLTRILLRNQMFQEANVLINRTLQFEPENATALVFQAVLRAAQGEQEAAIADIEAVLKDHPKNPDGWLFRGMLSMQQGNMERMKESFGKFVEVAPDGPQKERIRAMMAR